MEFCHKRPWKKRIWWTSFRKKMKTFEKYRAEQRKKKNKIRENTKRDCFRNFFFEDVTLRFWENCHYVGKRWKFCEWSEFCFDFEFLIIKIKRNETRGLLERWKFYLGKGIHCVKGRAVRDSQSMSWLFTNTKIRRALRFVTALDALCLRNSWRMKERSKKV